MVLKIREIETIRLSEFSNLIWVLIHTEDGLYGLGETFMGAGAVDAYIEEWAAPKLIGEDALRIEYLARKLRPYVGYQGSGVEVRGNSAIDIALWDLWGKATDQPVHQLLGGRFRDSIRTYNTCAGYRYIRSASGQNTANWGYKGDAEGPYEDLDGFLNRADEVAESLLADGITGMKIWPLDFFAEESNGQYIGAQQLKQGLAPFEKIRKAVGDKMEIMLECHGLWGLPAALDIAKAVDAYDPFWIEDPIRMTSMTTLGDYKAQVSAKVTASELLGMRWNYRDMMEARAVDIVMLDIAWCGGLTEAKAISALADAFHLPVAPHDCTGPVVFAASCHFSLHAPNALIQESVRAFYTGWYKELVTAIPIIENGMVRPPEGPGLGLDLLPDIRNRPDAIVRRYAG